MCDCQAHQLPEPFLDLDASAQLLAVSRRSLTRYLDQHRAILSPPRYRFNERHVKHRMLPASDLRWLQARIIRPTLRLPPESAIA